jgi:hypothetical protein
MAQSDGTWNESPNRCQLYTMFNLAEAIKDSGDPEQGINNTSILQYLVDYYGEDFFPISTLPTSAEGKTLGFLWPYTPTINTNVNVEYATTGLVNSPYQYNNYVRGQPPSLTVSGQFSANTVQEATLLLAIIHFLRSVTKQRFGQSEFLPGAPPPVCYFTAYGRYMYKNVPVVVQSFNMDLPETVDYVYVPNPYESNAVDTTGVPTLMTISCTFLIQYRPSSVREEFNMRDFTQGKLTSKGYI